MITSSDNSSHILKKDVSDIFEQIKKKKEDLSTSDGSIPLFQNLSNPTNLTNPQIIGLKRGGYMENSEETKDKSRNLKPKNRVNRLRRVKSEISELHDEFLISEEIKKLLLQKEPKRIFDKPKKRNYEMDAYTKMIEKKKRKEKLEKTIEPVVNEENIWTKLKKIQYIPHDQKEIRVNKRKNISAREYISNTKDIQLMKYINRHKFERYNMLSNIRQSELDSLTNTLISLEKSKDSITNNYNEKYASYVAFLKQEKDEEEKNSLNLFLQKERIKREIAQLQVRFNKIKKDRLFMVNMVLLQIQVKEQMRNIPEKALIIFDNNMNILLKDKRRQKRKRTITIKSNSNDVFDQEIKKVMKYKRKIIYNDISEFEYDYKQIEDKVINKYQEYKKLETEIEELKEIYNKEKAEKEYDPEAEDKKQCTLLLNKLKHKNEELKKEKISLKIKFSDKRHNILNKSRPMLQHSLSSISLRSSNNHNNNNINNINSNNSKSTINYFLKTNMYYYDTYNTLGLNNLFTLSNFNFNKMHNVSELYNYCFKLYKTAKNNLFDDIEVHFEVEKNMTYPIINEDVVILKMLDYIDKVLSLLLFQKQNHMSDEELRKKYEKLKSLMEGEKRRMKFINNFRQEEEKKKMKLKELELKKNIVKYIPTKKIDYNYYSRAQKEHLAKLKKLAELKKPITFEDFMYDVMV